jgi:hypothetical protein
VLPPKNCGKAHRKTKGAQAETFEFLGKRNRPDQIVQRHPKKTDPSQQQEPSLDMTVLALVTQHYPKKGVLRFLTCCFDYFDDLPHLITRKMVKVEKP